MRHRPRPFYARLLKNMEFVLVSRHSGVTLSNHLKSMDIISVPDAFLVYMGCESKEEYIASIVTSTFHTDYETIIGELKSKRYVPINGKVVFRHIKTMRTATVLYCADCVYEDNHILLISKVRHIHWQDNDKLVGILGCLCARRSLNTIQWRTVHRNDRKCIAVPQNSIQLSGNTKAQMEFLKCEFGVNTVYHVNGNGTQTYRSILIPQCLLACDLPDLSCEKYWGIVDFLNPQTPVFLEGSQAYLDLMGLNELKGDFKCKLEEQMTASEVSRAMRSIIPNLQLIEQGGTYTAILEFMTVHGREKILCTWYKTRSIVLAILHYGEKNI